MSHRKENVKHTHCNGCQNACKNSCNACTKAIIENTGNYFLEVANIGTRDAFYMFDTPERTVRLALYSVFLVKANDTFRDSLAKLRTCKNDECCLAAAVALKNSTLGYVTLAFNASVTADAQQIQLLLDELIKGLDKTVASIFENLSCQLVYY